MKKLSIFIGSVVLSLNMAWAADDISAPIVYAPNPAPAYPGVFWNITATPQVTIDQASTQYLPYLPWINGNVSLLAQYVNFFYQMAKDSNTGVGNLPIDSITVLSNPLIPTQQQTTQTNASDWTKTAVQTILPSLSPSNNAIAMSKTLMALPGSDTSKSCNPTDIVCQQNNANLNAAFNADTLFGNDGYAPAQANIVQGLVNFMSNNIDPLSSISSTGSPDLNNLNVQKYMLQTRAITAAQSLALSNLNYLAQERQIVPGLGTKAGMVELPTDAKNIKNSTAIADASLLQLQNFLVNQRFGNSTWYSQVNTASSIAMQRETLFMLANIQQQLQTANMLHERTLATLSVMLMQMLQYSRSTMMILQQNVQDTTDQINKTANG